MKKENITFSNAIIDFQESFIITPRLRYAEIYVEIGEFTAQKQPKLQQLWIGNKGTEKWEFIETVDLT